MASGSPLADSVILWTRILPDPRLFRTDEEVVFSVSQLRRNFADALVFLAFIPLAELMEWLKHIQAVPSIALW